MEGMRPTLVLTLPLLQRFFARESAMNGKAREEMNFFSKPKLNLEAWRTDFNGEQFIINIFLQLII